MADAAENTATPDTDTQPATGELGDAGKKALDAERKEKRAAEKRAAELEARLKEFEDRDKSESERAVARAEEAERRAAGAESRLSRLEVLIDSSDDDNVKRLVSMSKRLVGETREELEADAKELLSTFKPATTDESHEDVSASLDLGNRGGAPRKGSSTAEQFAAAIDGSFTR